MPSSIKVRFKVPVGWTACKVYSWEGSTPLCGAWPGTAMTLENDGYYTYNVTGFANLPIGVVFNNGATTGLQQTVDLFTSTDKCWDAGPLSGGKYTAIEVTCPPVGIENQADFSWNLFPNPTNGTVHFTAPDNGYNVSVTSALGMPMEVVPVRAANTCRVDLSGFPAGVYYLTLTAVDGKRVTRAVVKY
jgi:hypothetical protein